MKENKKNNGKSPKQEKTNKDFPGYPHYPKSEDVMSSDNAEIFGAVESESEIEEPAAAFRPAADLDEADDPELQIVDGTDADVTEEDIDELERDGLQDRNFHPDEIDVPGSDLDDEMEKIGEEDEENNYYSLGGDDKENLEENPDR